MSSRKSWRITSFLKRKPAKIWVQLEIISFCSGASILSISAATWVSSWVLSSAAQRKARGKSALLLEKLLNWLLKAENCQRLTLFFKMQILVLCLDWVLVKTPLQVPLDEESQNPNLPKH